MTEYKPPTGKVLLSSLDIGDYFYYTDDAFGHCVKSDAYRKDEYYGQVIGSAIQPSMWYDCDIKSKIMPIRYGKKMYRPNTGVVFCDDEGKMERITLSVDLYVTKGIK